MHAYHNNVAVTEDRYAHLIGQNDFSYPDQQFAQVNQECGVNVKLQDEELWNQFSSVTTEMIVTKGGRRMFPGYRINLEGLNPNAQYCVLMDVVSVDQHRYKFQQGEWVVAGRGEPQVPQRFYLHPNSPCNGAKWMKDIVTFHKVKLTNSCGNSANGKFFVHSMHQYQIRIHVVRTDDVSSLHLQPMSTYEFPQTKFITVTAYQNIKITQLKIDNNPFARGFRKGGKKNIKQSKTSPSNHSYKRSNVHEITQASKIMRQQPSPASNDSTSFPYTPVQQEMGYYYPPSSHVTCNNYYQPYPTYEFASQQNYQYPTTNTCQVPCQQYQQSGSEYFKQLERSSILPQQMSYPSIDHQSSYSANAFAFRSPVSSTDEGYYSTTGGNMIEDSNNEFCELLPANYSPSIGF